MTGDEPCRRWSEAVTTGGMLGRTGRYIHTYIHTYIHMYHEMQCDRRRGLTSRYTRSSNDARTALRPSPSPFRRFHPPIQTGFGPRAVRRPCIYADAAYLPGPPQPHALRPLIHESTTNGWPVPSLIRCVGRYAEAARANISVSVQQEFDIQSTASEAAHPRSRGPSCCRGQVRITVAVAVLVLVVVAVLVVREVPHTPTRTPRIVPDSRLQTPDSKLPISHSCPWSASRDPPGCTPHREGASTITPQHHSTTASQRHSGLQQSGVGGRSTRRGAVQLPVRHAGAMVNTALRTRSRLSHRCSSTESTFGQSPIYVRYVLVLHIRQGSRDRYVCLHQPR